MHMEWWVWSQTGIPKPNRLRYYLFCETNIAAATDLLEENNFYYFLSGINVDIYGENLLVRQRRRCGGNFSLILEKFLQEPKS